MALTRTQRQWAVGGSIGAVALFFLFHRKEITRPVFAPPQLEDHHHRRKKHHRREDHDRDCEEDSRGENDRGEYGRKHHHRRHERD